LFLMMLALLLFYLCSDQYCYLDEPMKLSRNQTWSTIIVVLDQKKLNNGKQYTCYILREPYLPPICSSKNYMKRCNDISKSKIEC